MTTRIGILGGTFDPIHIGHLRLAIELRDANIVDQVRFLPSARPPHRQPPVASAADRLAMTRAAVDTLTEQQRDLNCLVDDREYRRDAPSYMVDTLHDLRHDFPDAALCLILGSDAFGQLHRWDRWTQLLELAHLILCRRPNENRICYSDDLPTELKAELAARQIDSAKRLKASLAGSILDTETPELAISASSLRERLRNGKNPALLVPDAVLDIIEQRGLYRHPRDNKGETKG